MGEATQRKCTFIVKILNQQNATWQGEVVWLDNNEKRLFRSMLELIKLVDGVLNEDGTFP